ncbi:MAG: hypothetical protein AB7N76_06105 [Planctomycetota bacterium]
MSFLAWQRVLLGLSCFFTVFGVLAAVAPEAPWFQPWIAAMDQAFCPAGVSPEAAALRRFLMGPLGGTMAGSYLLTAFVVAGPFHRREAWAWHAVLWSTLLWFVVDSSVSLWRGAAFNVWMINVVPVVLYGVPLAATRGAFVGAEAPYNPEP